MQDNFKPGGGNKPQPYIPAGNGERSGEYTSSSNRKSKLEKALIRKFRIFGVKDVPGKYNFCNSKYVQKVETILNSNEKGKTKPLCTSNSVVKKIVNGQVVTERYYNDKGEAYLDIDYTNHNRPKSHPFVPHIHHCKLIYNSENKAILIRGKGEELK